MLINCKTVLSQRNQGSEIHVTNEQNLAPEPQVSRSPIPFKCTLTANDWSKFTES
jgi:hypothetical protein